MKKETLSVWNHGEWFADLYESKNANVMERLKNNEDYSLGCVYNDWSDRKQDAFDYCTKLCYLLDGYHLRILGHNSMTFSVGFMFKHPKTGETCTAYITRDHNRFARVL